MCSPEQQGSDQTAKPPSHQPEGWRALGGLTIAQAEQLLDWLEAHGVVGIDVSFAQSGVTVRWKE
jgi:hypothetical protein